MFDQPTVTRAGIEDQFVHIRHDHPIVERQQPVGDAAQQIPPAARKVDGQILARHRDDVAALGDTRDLRVAAMVDHVKLRTRHHG